MTMAIKPLSALTSEDKDAMVEVQVNRKWEFRANVVDGPVLHVDMILTDRLGNAMYAEIPADLVEDKASLLQVDKVYTINRFKITKAKSSYRAVDGPLMMYITYYSEIKFCRDPPSSFPRYIYRLTSYNDINPYGPAAKKFHDVLGIITEVSAIETRAASSSSSQFRTVFIKDLSDNIMKVTLWGDKAQHFSYDSVYEPEKQKPIVVLFVGCLPKDFRGDTYLSGGAACYWYFNPPIQEAESFYSKISSEKILLQLPPTPQQQVPQDKPPEREHKNLKEILDLGPYGLKEHGCDCTVTITGIDLEHDWWYIACTRCVQKMTLQDSTYLCLACGTTDYTFRYKLTFTASDGTAESKMFCYENVAKAIIGRPCSSLIGCITGNSSIPPPLAAIVSKKFTFAIVFTKRSFEVKQKTLYITSIVASHGRDHSLPQVQQSIDALCPSTPTKSMIIPKASHSPSLPMSRLSTSTPSAAKRMLAYSPVRDTPSVRASPKYSPSTQTTSEDIDAHIHSSAPSPFESPPKRFGSGRNSLWYIYFQA